MRYQCKKILNSQKFFQIISDLEFTYFKRKFKKQLKTPNLLFFFLEK